MSKFLIHTKILFLSFFAATLAFAQDATLQVQPVTDGIYAIIGPHEQRNADNLANNATFGFVVTDEGVVLVDPGGSYKGAAQVLAAIRTVTDKPVTHVINTGGQDHRWLGNGFFKERGASIIASKAAVADHHARVDDHFFLLRNLMGEAALAGTEPVYADKTFENELTFEQGGVRFELYHVGSAHTLGDAFVWLPQYQVMFSGDIVYVDRMLGIGPAGDTRQWIETFNAMAAFDPEYIVPGHGPVTDLERARAETLAYLQHLRDEIAQVLDAGGTIEEGTHIDQSTFSHLAVFEQIAKRNAQAVYMQMEWE